MGDADDMDFPQPDSEGREILWVVVHRGDDGDFFWGGVEAFKIIKISLGFVILVVFHT